MATEKLNINNLLRQLQNGEEQAFSRLYDEFAKQLYKNILRLVKDEDIAQEILQDTFLKIWTSRENLKIEGSFKALLFKISENLVYGHFRKIVQDNRLIAKLALSCLVYESNVEEKIISKENHDLLYRAIAALSPQRKQVYTLCKIEGKSYEEVSQQLGISTSTISNHIVKANKAIKNFLVTNSDLAVLMLIIESIKHRN